MIGLALEGGGAKGSYQIGAYYAMKDCGIKFDGFCGTSIGAFNSAMLACGKSSECLEFWQNVNIASILGFDQNFIKKIVNRQIDFDFLIRSFKGAVRVLKNRGVETKGLLDVLTKNVNETELRKSKKDYGLCTVRVNDLTPLYLFKEDMKDGLLHDYILASCYLPFFRIEKKVDNHYYIDGGFYDNSPVNMLIDKKYTKIYVVRVNVGLSINITKKPKKNVDITYIKPSRSVGGMIEFNDAKVHDNIYMGYYDTLRVLRNYDGYIYTFKHKKDAFFNRAVRKVEEAKLRRVKNFFGAKTNKKAVVKAIEYIMQKENIDYYKVYRIRKVIRNLKRYYKKDHFIYDFVGSLKIL